ncbi:hypothetical protein [Actinocorallia longicatena]|uniref:Uncharacterized protein n=1 Tax=Actinocorallia longicatena TaxID=111803 RepID=A0ABP6QCD6_9ACTN
MAGGAQAAEVRQAGGHRDSDGDPNERAIPCSPKSVRIDRMIADLRRSRAVLDEAIETASGS